MRLLAPTLLAAFAFTLLTPVVQAAEKGMLRIVTEPGDAQLFINGKRKGNSPAEAGQSFAIKLDEGEYRVQAVKAEGEHNEYYGEKRVYVAEDSLQTVAIDLKSRLSEKGKQHEAGRKAEEEQRKAEKARQVRAQIAKAIAGIERSMVALPAGSFTMGSPSDEAQRSSDEGPQHTVNIPAFEMAKHELTFDEWDACVADGGCEHRPQDQGWGRGNRPVINVNWDDAQQYLAWINRKTGKRYRLPSEAEWEYAARAGTTTRFSTGDCITTDQANFDGNTPAQGCPKGESRGKTLPVGSLTANPWGLFDMHGNVWEWTHDCWKDSYYGAPEDGSARTDGDCSRRVYRGGSWSYGGYRMRSATRDYGTRDYRYFNLGFRLSRSR